ncbi:MAG: hypothetical protein ACK4UP_13365 [Spirosomataceae bacterium]
MHKKQKIRVFNAAATPLSKSKIQRLQKNKKGSYRGWGCVSLVMKVESKLFRLTKVQ